MAKLSSNKSPAQPKKDAGCMWGFMNLFDFRQGQRTPRLLSDKKSGNNELAGNGHSRVIVDSIDSLPKRNDANTPNGSSNLASVKTLMEEEMSQYSTRSYVSNDKAQQATGEKGYEVQVKKNNSKRSKKSKVTSDARVNNQTSPAGLDNHQSGSSIDISTLSTDLAAFLVQFYSHGYQLQQAHIEHDEDGSLPNSEVTSEKVNNSLDETDSLLDEKQSILKKALADLTQMITSQNYIDEKMSNGSTQSNEFLDVLNTLSANKESFLKILEHPDSHFLEQFQDFQNGNVGRFSNMKSDKYPKQFSLLDKKGTSAIVEEPDGSEHLHKQSRYSFFWKHKSKATVPSQGCPSSQSQNKIVVLKPNPDRITRSALIAATASSPQPHRRPTAGNNRDKTVPFFSLKEMKRRIKNMFGESKKARHAISMDGILHKVPIGSKDSADTDKLMTKNSPGISSVDAEAAAVSNKKDKQITLEESDLNISTDVALPLVGDVINKEGRKHLAEILDSGDQGNNAATVHVSETLGRILSLPEYTNLLAQPSSESEQAHLLLTDDHKLTSPQKNCQDDSSNTFSSSIRNLEAESYSNRILHHELRMLDLKVELFESHKLDPASIRMNVNQEGPSAANTFDITVVNNLDATSTSNDFQVSAAGKIYVKEKECTQGLIETQNEILSELPPSSSPAESTILSELAQPSSSPVGSAGKPGKKSPASVLEKFYSDDATNPEWMTVRHSRRQLKPRQLSFEDDMLPRTSSSLQMERYSKTYFGDKQARLAYIKTVLDASQLNSDEQSERWYWADHLLEPDLFEEIETSSYQLQDDPKLLFDCINEVLSEIQERHYKIDVVTPCVRPNPVGANLIHEVSKEVDRHLRTASPKTVDQIMKRDLDSGTWMNFQEETEDMVIDIWDTLLDDLMEEAVFDLWFFDDN